MKILSIEIKNLASISKASIDFTTPPLSSAGLFAITGPTGAGKSTILDAMCLALYGKTPRYITATETGLEIQDISGQKLSQGDVKFILMDGTAAGFSKVIFEGTDKQQYLAEWHVKRARDKDSGRLQPETLLVTNLTTGAILGQKKKESLAVLEDRIGLNFQQFTRSVLLAQGDFTAFLKADKDSKASLLEKLTGTEIYSEISKNIYEKYKEAENNLKELRLRLDGIELINQDEIEGLQAEEETIILACQQKEQELNILKNDLQWYDMLRSLQVQKSNAEEAFNEASKEQGAFADRKHLLEKVEEVQKIRSNFERREEAAAEWKKKKEAYEQQEEENRIIKKELEDLQCELSGTEDLIKAQKEEIKEYIPLFAEARRLDTVVLEKIEGLNLIQNEYNRHLRNESLLKDTEFAYQEKIAEHQAQIIKLKQWHQENTLRKPIAENISLIYSRLKDGSNRILAIREEEVKLENIRKELRRSENELSFIRAEIGKHHEILNTILLQASELQLKIAHISIDDLNSSYATLGDKRARFIKAAAVWRRLVETKLNHKKSSARLASLKDKEEKESILLAKEKDNLKNSKIEKDYAEHILDKTRLQMAENVESIRNRLKKGEQCPVCGSLEHPFRTTEPRLHNLLQNFENEVSEKNELYENLLNKCARLETSLQNTQQTISEISKEIIQQKQEIKKCDIEWRSTVPDSAFPLLAEGEVIAFLENTEEEIRKEISCLQEQIKKYQQVKILLDKTIENQHDKETNLRRLSEKLAETKAELRSLKVWAEQSENIKGKEQAQLNLITEELNVFFQNKSWVEKWKKDAENFLIKIREFSESWTANMDQLNEEKQALDQKLLLIQTTQQQLSVLSKEGRTKQQILEQALKEKEELKNLRKQLLEGKDADSVEKKMRTELEKLEESRSVKKNTFQDLHSRLTGKEIQLQNTRDSLAVLQNTHDREQTFLQNWLTVYNTRNERRLSPDSLHELIKYKQDWLQNERIFFEKLDKAIVETRSVFLDKCKMIEIHKASSTPQKSYDILQDKIKNLHTSIEDLNFRKNEIHIILRQQKAHQIRFLKLKRDLEKNQVLYDRWSKLNDLIGSSDGKKFRTIAQEYTLDILLLHANHHLKFLSKRYILSRIPDTLGLQVSDLEMGAETRTVYSLSGGESFLVSLALALGLASLSSEKMQVESLFIDEGFGALDPQTLDMAMDALDRLHQQGRKVGIISHVQEMKERITTQIRVEKMYNGKSRISIEG